MKRKIAKFLEKTKWIRIFLTDIFLIFVVGALQFWTNFNSKVVFLITGMLVVYISWQFTDYSKYRRAIAEWQKLQTQ